MAQFFIQEKEHKLDINITAVTSQATGISGRLINTILKEGKGSLEKGELFFSTRKGKKYSKIIVNANSTHSAFQFYTDKKRKKKKKRRPSIRRL